jgi:hypothetical protein
MMRHSKPITPARREDVNDHGKRFGNEIPVDFRGGPAISRLPSTEPVIRDSAPRQSIQIIMPEEKAPMKPIESASEAESSVKSGDRRWPRGDQMAIEIPLSDIIGRRRDSGKD